MQINLGLMGSKYNYSAGDDFKLSAPCDITFVLMRTGPRLNIKTVLSTYGDFHVKDKTAVRTSYL